jgi:hypothetical protein
MFCNVSYGFATTSRIGGTTSLAPIYTPVQISFWPRDLFQATYLGVSDAGCTQRDS